MSRLALLGAVLVTPPILLGCGGAAPRDDGPNEVLRQYATYLEERRIEDAYALLSDEAKKGMPFEAFQTMVKENPEEIRAMVESLRRPMNPPRVTARVSTPSGETLLMVYEAGAWRVDGSAIHLYDRTTPTAALQSFVRAVENRRYDVLLEFVPDEKLEGLDEKTLKEAFEGEQREEVERTTQAIKAALPTADIEQVGDRATFSYGAGGTIQLVRQHGAWKIEDF